MNTWLSVTVYADDKVARGLLVALAGALNATDSVWHYFFGEPGRAAFTLRVEEKHLKVVKETIAKYDTGSQISRIDYGVYENTFDKETFGDYLDAVNAYFHGCSVLGAKLLAEKGHIIKATEAAKPVISDMKFIHCALNMWGYSRADEVIRYGLMQIRAQWFAALQQAGMRDADDDPRGVFSPDFHIAYDDP